METTGAGRDRRLLGGSGSGGGGRMVAIEFEDGTVVEREALVEATWEDGVEEEIWVGAGRDDMDVDGTLWGIAVVFKLECMVAGGGEGGETQRRAFEVDEGVESCGCGGRGRRRAVLDPGGEDVAGELVGDEGLAGRRRGPRRAWGARANAGAKERVGLGGAHHKTDVLAKHLRNQYNYASRRPDFLSARQSAQPVCTEKHLLGLGGHKPSLDNARHRGQSAPVSAPLSATADSTYLPLPSTLP